MPQLRIDSNFPLDAYQMLSRIIDLRILLPENHANY